MRKNRLIIKWNNTVGFKSFRESLRCNSIEAARRIIKKRRKENILIADFRDSFGDIFSII